jgi:hypothetical protein
VLTADEVLIACASDEFELIPGAEHLTYLPTLTDLGAALMCQYLPARVDGCLGTPVPAVTSPVALQPGVTMLIRDLLRVAEGHVLTVDVCRQGGVQDEHQDVRRVVSVGPKWVELRRYDRATSKKLVTIWKVPYSRTLSIDADPADPCSLELTLDSLTTFYLTSPSPERRDSVVLGLRHLFKTRCPDEATQKRGLLHKFAKFIPGSARLTPTAFTDPGPSPSVRA